MACQIDSLCSLKGDTTFSAALLAEALHIGHQMYSGRHFVLQLLDPLQQDSQSLNHRQRLFDLSMPLHLLA
jgi:hypothetical protein